MAASGQPGPSPDPGQLRPDAGPVDPSKKYWWAGAIAVPVLVAVIGLSSNLLKKDSKSISIDSHDLNFQQINVIEREYQQKTGQQLPPDVRQQIEAGLENIRLRRYQDGAQSLGAAADKAQVPSLLADYGTALAAAGHAAEAQKVFDQVDAADPSNAQTKQGRQYLNSLRENNSILTAAEIPVGKTVAATLLDNDTDFFKFTAPSGPRDHLRVRLQNRSQTLGLQMEVKGPDKAPIGGNNGAPAADVNYEFPATPGAIHYLQVSPYYSGGGSYTLTVEPTHSFDAYEPNDTILAAKDIPTGSLIEANIMDRYDMDFYRFQARGAKTTIDVENRSSTLGIGLAVSDADKAAVGGNNGAVAANVHYQFDSKPGSTYYLQIFPYYSEAGKYAFTIR